MTIGCSVKQGEQANLTSYEWLQVIAIEGPLPLDLRRDLESISSSSNSRLRAAAAVILYREDPNQYWDTLFESYAVHDYVLRKQGIQNFIGAEEMASKLNEIESSCLDSGLGRTPVLLLAFLEYQEKNQWLEFEDGARISLARFFRTAFLAQMLPALDAEDIANRMDQAAREQT
ncbi:MAG: hypothetical protein COA70_09225 [Planctomycetota bacterium]|nr:MAG: hypothetical protein COA70_09225 [Planctomycetota bacterium]